MARRTLTLDVYVHRTPERAVARLLQHDDIAAAAPTELEALAKLEALLLHLERRDPGGLEEAEGPATLRTLKLTMPATLQGKLFDLEIAMLAVLHQEDDIVTVTLPQVSVVFGAQDATQIEQLAQEYLREEYALDSRVVELLAFLTPWTLSTDPEAEPQAPVELAIRQLTVELRSGAEPEDPSAEAASAEMPTLTAIGEPMHLRHKNRDAPRAFGRKASVDLMLDYLSQPHGRSILLTGPAGVGKSAIVAEMVGRMVKRDAPEELHGVGVWQISGGRIMAGMRYLGQWQERVLSLIEEAKRHGVILFAENLLELLETSGTEAYAQGVPGLLLPPILSGDLVLITEARPEQLAHAEQRHPSFVRALRKLPVDPMTAEETDQVLERVSFRLGRQYGVRLGEETRQKILELTARFRGSQAFPGPAVELAERTAMTHHKAGVAKEDEDRPILLPDHAMAAYATQTGLPRVLLDPNLDFSVGEVRGFFENAVFAQPEAVEAMTDLVTVLRAGLHAPHRPMGSFLFLGPTGVGKTQTALTLAEYLFGSRDRLLRFDMSEYQDAWSAGRLVGRYKGEQGELVRRIREEPFRVVLLDEIEKADGAVFDLLLQALGEGRLTDGLGQTVHLTSTVFIMTSNLGAGGPPSLGFGTEDARVAREASHYRKAVEDFFRPEFIGRIDNIIPFRSLTRDTAHKLVTRALEQAFGREGLTRRQVRVKTSEAVIEYLISAGFDERYGARPLRQAVERHITAPLAAFIASLSDIQDLELLFRMGAEGKPELELL